MGERQRHGEETDRGREREDIEGESETLRERQRH